MSTTGVHVFDGTLHEANGWLKAVMTRLDTGDEHLALMALRGALHALRDRIGPGSAAHFGAQLPTLLRGIYYEGWRPERAPSRERHKQDFLEHVRRDFPDGTLLDPEGATRAVTHVMWEKVDPGAVVKLVRVLPEELRDLWPEKAQREAQEEKPH